jgi:hypothetical protein
MIEGFGWVYVVVVLDWHSKKVVGHYAGLQYNRLRRWPPHERRCPSLSVR